MPTFCKNSIFVKIVNTSLPVTEKTAMINRIKRIMQDGNMKDSKTKTVVRQQKKPSQENEMEKHKPKDINLSNNDISG